MTIYPDIYAGPPASYIRERTTKRWVVIHSTQNDASAEGEASYATRRSDGVSFHYAVDADSIVQSLDTAYGAHHVGSSTGNRGGIAYECVGFAAWSRSTWLDRLAWPLLARQIRLDCADHGITPRLLTVEQIKAGTSGIITHNQARLAWGGTDHTDPGPGFPLDYLVQLVTEEDDMPTAAEIVDELLSRRIPPNAWSIERWGMREDGYSVGTYLLGAYTTSRAAWEDVRAASAELEAQVAGLSTLVQRLAAAPGVQLTAEQLEQLTAAVREASTAAGQAVLERLTAAGEALAGEP